MCSHSRLTPFPALMLTVICLVGMFAVLSSSSPPLPDGPPATSTSGNGRNARRRTGGDAASATPLPSRARMQLRFQPTRANTPSGRCEMAASRAGHVHWEGTRQSPDELPARGLQCNHDTRLSLRPSTPCCSALIWSRVRKTSAGARGLGADEGSCTRERTRTRS